MESPEPLRFIRLRCSIDVSFWSAVADKILNEWKGSDGDQPIHGFYEFSRDRIPSLHLNAESLSNPSPNRPGSRWSLDGTLKLLPNAKSWDRFDALAALTASADRIWDDLETERVWRHPHLLSRFLLVLYADVKRYQFQYWFALPAIAPKLPIRRLSSETIRRDYVPESVAERLASSSDAFFATRLVAGEATALEAADDAALFAFIDPTNEQRYPTWLMRNYIAAVAYKFGPGRFSFLCVKSLRPFVATIETVAVDDRVAPRAAPTGWELNVRGQPGPRFVDLGSAMDPSLLASSSVNLNLRLMKWREFPALNLAMLNGLKVLILGAGTLGCDVARNLAAWGVRDFTFIDNGVVAFSNPTRQSLYSFADCTTGTKHKATAAAEAMRQISPSINAKGYVSTIAMVGHPLGASMAADARKDFDLLERCIDACDIVFLLTDSRESRWLPTVLCAAKNRHLINCALGFDTFVVTRHGVQMEGAREKLGCYFCADVSAPGDSLSDRTLDKQCTVTRPGVGAIASSLAVEMAISLLHDPSAEPTPPGTSFSWSYDRKDSLGFVPHQLRGWLAQFHIAIVKGDAYPRCIACSETVVSQYKERGWEFIQSVVNEPLRLEEMCGISELKTMAEDFDWELEPDG